MAGSEIYWQKMQKMIVDYDLSSDAKVSEAARKCMNKGLH